MRKTCLGLKPQAKPVKPAESRFWLPGYRCELQPKPALSRFEMIEPGVSTQGGTAKATALMV
jgi:hypothetical protein